MSKDAADLLKNILNTDAEKWFTIEQIRDHPWYKQIPDVQYKGIVVGQDQIPIDEKLLNELVKLEFKEDYSSKCIMANKHNNVTAVYNILLKKSLKKGTITITDAFSLPRNKND